MKKLLLFSVILSITFACSNNTPSTQNPEIKQVPEKKLTTKKMSFEDAINLTSDERIPVIVEGYVQLSVMTNINNNSQSVNFYGHKNQTTGNYIYTNIPMGSGKNQMKQLPAEYRPKDVSILDKNNKKIGMNQRVRFHGIMYAVESYSKDKKHTVYFDVTEIEYVDEVKDDYAAMNLPVLSPKGSKLNNNYDKAFKAEGILEVPMFVLIDNETNVDLLVGGEKISLKIVTGTEASQIAELGENWLPKDVKINDADGKPVNLKKKVTVYGTLSLDGLHVEQIVQ